ncbi:PREDICTED: ecotropic viral integration site 5 ortholog-like isoform X2 [Priapulus caudatus]|uniref:Ecotropic viral integration site 5 ortholog-like isoform X2 n=1 Tax=Priapulus caudatus TaxID=37621 RepID=A0ABM1FB99_PRICU|nr:PREDICTED: ecotropic viral integration site 5 ortholog-like isoform X2 [Priapulus caudatus]
MFSSKSDSDLPQFSIGAVNIGYFARKFAQHESSSDSEATDDDNADAGGDDEAVELGDLGGRIREAWTSMHVVRSFKMKFNRLLESDVKSLNSISGVSGLSTQSSLVCSSHSRHSSSGSLVSSHSNQSHMSNATNDDEVAAAVAASQEEDSWVVWGRIVNDWENCSKKKAVTIKELIRRGIPCHFRGIVWQLVCNAFNSPDRERFADYLKQSSPSEKVIRRDIARTYPEHEFFKEKDGTGQESLFNVMKAYSLHDREVGYCQGSGFIVGLLLMQMPEEEAFCVLVKLMQEYEMREMFKPSMARLGLCMFQLECMVQEQLLELHSHFQSQSFYTSMYASSWFLTLFTTTLPMELACRVMDVFISEGIEAIFRIAMAILIDSKNELMSLDMEGMLKYFQKDMPEKYAQDPDQLLYLSYQVKYNAKKMKRLEKEYNTLKSKEAEEQIELRRLRTENRLLRQRIDMLEQESAALADRLIQGQVTRAQEAEESFQVKRELAAVKQVNVETASKLSVAKDELERLKEKHKLSRGTTGLSLKQAEEVIQALQQELLSVRLREAESTASVKELKSKIDDLGESNRQMSRMAPSNQVASLQEELISVKLREAEANLSMKELRQKVVDLEQTWQKHMVAMNMGTKNQSNNKNQIQQLYSELMTVKLREADTLMQLKEVRQRVMELDTQSQMSSNQLKRADEEQVLLREQLDEAVSRERKLHDGLRGQERKYADLETRCKEEQMMARLREAELSQQLAEMTQKIAALEIGKQELVTMGALHKHDKTDEIKELQAQIADLQTEVVQLRIDSNFKTSPSCISASIPVVDEDDDDGILETITMEMKSPALEELARDSSMANGHVNGHVSPSSGQCA